jgi:hypothetical protein
LTRGQVDLKNNMKKDFTSIDNKLLKSINDLKTLISDQETVM